MNTRNILCTLPLATLLFTACKKEGDDLPPSGANPSSAMAWAQLKPGNYWIYQRFKIDTAGVEVPVAQYDSCYVAGDTAINGTTYYKMVRPAVGVPGPSITYLRDSSGYLVDHHGGVRFAVDDFSTVFRHSAAVSGGDTVAVVTWKMANDGEVVSTPAGFYATKDFLQHWLIDPDFVVHFTEYQQHARYAEGIGIVVETLPFYLSAPYFFERRLVSYHLEP